MDTIWHTLCPETRRGKETFAQHVEVGGEVTVMSYTKDIIWIRNSESHTVFLHGGEVLKDNTTHFNDFYGFLTSMSFDRPTPVEIAAHYGITAESSLEMIVQTEIFETPVIETPETIEYNINREPGKTRKYVVVPDNWRTVSTDSEGKTLYPMLRPVCLFKGPSWSSKNTPEQNAQLLADIKAAWEVPEAA